MSRLEPHVRKEQILEAAVGIAAEAGLYTIRREDVALKAEVACGLVNRYFGTMNQLRRAVMRHAISNRNLSIIAEGIARRDPQAMKAPDDLRREAINSLVG